MRSNGEIDLRSKSYVSEWVQLVFASAKTASKSQRFAPTEYVGDHAESPPTNPFRDTALTAPTSIARVHDLD